MVQASACPQPPAATSLKRLKVSDFELDLLVVFVGLQSGS